jgi:hypothetical protein
METSHDNTDRLPASGFRLPASGFRLTSLLIASLLLVAATLKLYGVSVSPVPSVGWLALPQLQFTTILWEIGLGLWLISSLSRFSAWLVCLATFTLFATISCYLAFQGIATCGCFGIINASPWHVFLVDVSVIALLLLFRPTWNSAEFRCLLIPTAKVFVGTAVILSMIAVSGIFVYGSLSATLAKLRGDELDAPGYLDFGEATQGEVVVSRASITNYSPLPYKLIGGTSDCSCVTTSEMPLTIPANESVSMLIKFKVPAGSTPGKLTRTAELWTNCDKHRTLLIRLGVTVRPNS